MIFDSIPHGSIVLDLGCGDGSLMDLLRSKGCVVSGLEINGERVKECISRGLPVVQEDIDQGFQSYRDRAFDYVILNQTLQACHNPLLVTHEAMRVGRFVIVSFTNFAFYQVRSQLFFRGVMPKSKDLPYEWYDTPNIHLVTIKDFTEFCINNKFQIEQKIFYNDEKILGARYANLLSPYAMFTLHR